MLEEAARMNGAAVRNISLETIPSAATTTIEMKSCDSGNEMPL
jgi:hypothetical protein